MTQHFFMTRHVLMLILALGVAVPIWAQPEYRVEIQANGSFTLSEGIPVNPDRVGGNLINRITPKSGGSYGVSVGVMLSEQAQVGFNFAQQLSTLELTLSTGIGKRDATDMQVDNYHGTFTYNWGYSDAQVRPFFFAGLGATRYSPDSIMGIDVQGATRFSSTWGGGVKMYANDNIGFNFTGRWTPTYINSDPGGIWCSPYWPGGCWVLSDANYSHQFELGGGLNFRF